MRCNRAAWRAVLDVTLSTYVIYNDSWCSISTIVLETRCTHISELKTFYTLHNPPIALCRFLFVIWITVELVRYNYTCTRISKQGKTWYVITSVLVGVKSYPGNLVINSSTEHGAVWFAPQWASIIAWSSHFWPLVAIITLNRAVNALPHDRAREHRLKKQQRSKNFIH